MNGPAELFVWAMLILQGIACILNVLRLMLSEPGDEWGMTMAAALINFFIAFWAGFVIWVS